MRAQRRIVLVVAVAGLGAGLVTGAGAAAGAVAGPAAGVAAAAGTWHKPVEIPGPAALNAGGAAQVAALSCASAGNCSGGGVYHDGSARQQVFVVSQVSGVWGAAAEVPGSGALNAGGVAGLLSVSCGSAGNCAAGGYYTDGSAHQQAFVAVQVKGKWKAAVQVPGTAGLNLGGNAQVLSVSCGSAGNCSAGGYYTDGSGNGQAFVVSEAGGTWGTAREVPGSGTLNKGGNAVVSSVSCGSAGNCGAGGFYADGSGHKQAFAVSQVNGKWGTAKEVPGSGTLNKGGTAEVLSVSCGSAGNCGAGGYYADGSGHKQAFVVSQVKGTWGTAREVPGSGSLNKSGNARAASVSCGSAGNCTAGGFYADGSGNAQAFAVSQVSGKWGTAAEVPGTGTLNKGTDAEVTSVSCVSAGNCGAGGVYTDGSGHRQAFTAVQAGGTWRAAREVPGSGTLNAGGDARVTSVSCPAAGQCSAGGYYKDAAAHYQALVAGQVTGTWYPAIELPGLEAVAPGRTARVISVSCGSPGNCTVSGQYFASFGGRRPFVASQVHGQWYPAMDVPGSPALYAGTNESEVLSISCGSAGNCAAGGYYYDGSGNRQGYVLSQVSGEWGGARQVPGLGKLNGSGDAKVNAVSCASAGNCAASGYYTSGAGLGQAFVVSEVKGKWGTAREVPGSGTLNAGGDAGIDAVSCASAGICSASGYYKLSSGRYQEFAVSEVNGTWGTAHELPGTGNLNKGGDDSVYGMSCASAGNCAAGGYYTDASGHTQAFVVSQVNGAWHTAIEVPGTSTLNKGGTAFVNSVSCGSAGNCAAGGYYTDASGHAQAFVVSQVNGTWHKAVEVAGTLNTSGHAEIISVSCGSAGNCIAGGQYASTVSGFPAYQAFVISQVNGTWGGVTVLGGTLNAGNSAEVSSVSCRSAGKCSVGGYYTDGSSFRHGFVASQS